MKIFLTVGSMLPFDRLVKAVDEWALDHKEHQVFAQIGDGGQVPRAFDYATMLDPDSFRQHFVAADLVVSHAGMGTVMTAFELGRPLVLLPRNPANGEVTSNHQLSTALWLRGRPGITVVDSEAALPEAIATACLGVQVVTQDMNTRSELIQAVRQFILY